MLNLEILGSSSKGNCYLIKTSKEVLILECGVNVKKILEGLNFNVSNVAGALISHEHKDHSLSANELMRKGINVYSSEGTLKSLNISGHRALKIKSLDQIEIGGFTVLPFDVQHDASEPLGFLIHHEEFGKLLFATDTFYIKYKFDKVDYYMIECNFSSEILGGNIYSGLVHPQLKRRLMRSHFSVENLKNFFLKSDLSTSKQIYLIHLSDSNSDSNLFKNDIEKLTGVPVQVC